MIRKILLSLFSIILISCSNSESKREEVFLQSKTGHFLSPNWLRESKTIEDRFRIIDSKHFNITNTSEGRFELSNQQNGTIYIEDDTLKWDKFKLKERVVFELEQIGDRKFLKESSTGLYVRIKSKRPYLSPEKGVILHKLPDSNMFGGRFSNLAVISLILSLLIYLFLLTNEINLKIHLPRTTFYGLLVVANGLVAIYAVTLFGYLGVWDEQFHALVARNITLNPLIPKLYLDQPLHNSFGWIDGGVWLHKQPFFLYQMALSIKLFGANIFAVRLPSLILTSISSVFVYRIGFLLYGKLTGVIASFFYCFSAFKISLLFGVTPTDHNDLSFLFFVTVSFWALIEHLKNPDVKKFYYLIIVGATLAVLNKWLTGFLVFGAWGLFLLLTSNSVKAFFKNLTSLIKAVVISVFFVSLWQIYIILRFPKLAFYEYSLIGKHFSEVVERHGGAWDFHLLLTRNHYSLHFLVLIVLLIGSYFIFRENRKLKISILTSITAVHLFYGLAATKMPAFTFVIAPLVFIFIASYFQKLWEFFESIQINRLKKVLSVTFTFGVLLFSLNVFKIENVKKVLNDSSEGQYRVFKKQIEEKKFSEKKNMIQKPTIIFNCGNLNAVRQMFYNSKIIAYDYIPSKKTVNKAMKSGYLLAIYDNGELPEYILNNTKVQKLRNY